MAEKDQEEGKDNRDQDESTNKRHREICRREEVCMEDNKKHEYLENNCCGETHNTGQDNTHFASTDLVETVIGMHLIPPPPFRQGSSVKTGDGLPQGCGV
jgi:hypothetical protein